MKTSRTEQIKLIKEALNARKNAYTPYSHFIVGAALDTTEEKIYKGCNIENGAYSPTICAERTAFAKAVSEGERSFKAIAVVGGPGDEVNDVCAPCGVCRQVMQEFCSPDFEIILGKDESNYEVYTLAEILPLGFKL